LKKKKKATALKKKAEENKEEGDFLPSIGESLHNYVLSEKYSDVSFVVGSDKEVIRAHKVVLASRSPVFAAMLYSNFLESKNSESITVSDVEAEIFREMLRSIYSDDCDIDHSNLEALLNVANKYQIKGLAKQCALYMRQTLDKDNACDLLELTPDWMEPDDYILKFIDENALEVYKSKAFMKLSERRLLQLLSRDTLELEEAKVIEAVHQWAKFQCKQQELKETKENLSSLCKELLPALRIPTLSLEELALIVTPMGILDTTMLNNCFKYIAFAEQDFLEDERKIRPTGWNESDEGKREMARLAAERALTYPKLPFSAKLRPGSGNYDVSWMETTDSFKGFRALPGLNGKTRFWLCVSSKNQFDEKKKYGTPRGYEWAKSEMWHSGTVLSSNSDYNYYNQGGWNGYDWRSVSRHAFFFTDTLKTKKMIHAGNYASMGGFQDWNTSSGYNFAGLVVIKKNSWEPRTRRFKNRKCCILFLSLFEIKKKKNW